MQNNDTIEEFNELEKVIQKLDKKDISVPVELEERIKKRMDSIKISKRSQLKFIMIAAALSITCIASVAFGAGILKVFTEKTTSDTGLQLADKEGFVDTRGGVTEYNGISVGINGVFSDSIRTSIQVEVTGKELEGKEVNFEDVILLTSKGERYIPKKIPVIEKGVNIATIDFEGVKTNNSEEKLTLEIKEIGGISGYWALTFPVKVASGEKIYTSNKQYFFGKNKIVVGPIKSTISRTQIEVRDYFANKSIWTRVNMFYLVVNGKKYFADNFTDPLDQGETSIIDHKTYIVNFNTDGKEFSLNDEVYMELEYGISESRVVYKIPISTAISEKPIN